MTYITIQGFNTAYTYESNSESWKLVAKDHVGWLPSSLATPFSNLNPWRMLMYLAAPWLFLCYSYIGLNRRRSVLILLWTVWIQSILFCVLAILQKNTAAEGIFWTWEVHPNFFGSVPYKNRGAAILYVMMGSSIALYFYHLRDMRQRMKKSGPHLIVMLGIFLQYGTLWTSFSRGGIAIGSVLFGIFVASSLAIHFGKSESPLLKWGAVFIFIALSIGAIYTVKDLPGFEISIARFNEVEEDAKNNDFSGRLMPSKITWQMFEHRKWYGWGAGSWRYVFEYYLKDYPEVQYVNGVRLRWEDAHNDWFQYLSELGVIGASILLSFVLRPVIRFVKRIRTIRATHIVLVATLIGAVVHASIELLFQNMALLCLIAFSILLLEKLPLNRIRTK
ncbi:MAG: O-antigen ligase family protein [Opitutales bacterium]|nr:O-antigen ligase family protein [Opitutales bacterium]